MWHQPCQRLSTPLQWILKKCTIKKLVTNVESHASTVRLLKRAENSAIKAIISQSFLALMSDMFHSFLVMVSGTVLVSVIFGHGLCTRVGLISNSYAVQDTRQLCESIKLPVCHKTYYAIKQCPNSACSHPSELQSVCSHKQLPPIHSQTFLHFIPASLSQHPHL